MNHGLTTPPSIKQRLIYSYVRAFIATYGYPPPTERIASACRLPMGQVRYGLHKLEAKGYIRRRKSLTATTELTDKVLDVA